VCSPIFSFPSLSDRALSADTGKSAGTIMSITVNGVTVEVSRWPNPEVAAVRELMRQRAIAVGLLLPDTESDEAISAAIERLLTDEVIVPSPTDSECRRYYESHLKEFQAGDQRRGAGLEAVRFDPCRSSRSCGSGFSWRADTARSMTMWR
jgi:hypothetical protein